MTLDDTVLAKDQAFQADDIDGIRLSTMRACTVWYDEIYVGFDNTMQFSCPTTSRDKGTQTMGPDQKHWSLEELLGQGSTGYTEYYKMSRHYSHLDPFGSVQFDGRGLVSTNQDIKFKYPSGDYPVEQGKMKAGAMNYLTNSPRSAKSASGRSSTTVSEQGLWYSPPDGVGGAGDGRQYWYVYILGPFFLPLPRHAFPPLALSRLLSLLCSLSLSSLSVCLFFSLILTVPPPHFTSLHPPLA